MEELGNSTIIGTIIVSVLGGIGWLVKWFVAKRDENQKRIFAERDADKAEMKSDIEGLKKDLKQTNKRVNDIAGIIIGCDHPDCPSRKILADYMMKDEKD